jgi:hypothetical protein
MYGMYNAPPPPVPLTAWQQFGVTWDTWWSWAWFNLHSLGFGDLLNIHLAVPLLVVVLAGFLFAFRRYWRLRSLYGKRELVDINSDRVGLVGEWMRLSVRLLIPLSILVALLNPYLPGVPHRVPSGNRDYAVCIADNRGMGAVDSTSAPAEVKPGSNEFFHEAGSRMDLVRNTMRQLLDTVLVRTPVSLIAFQGGANVLVPLTDSSEWLKDTLDPKNKYGLRVGLSAPLGKGKVDGKVSTIAACFQAARAALKEGDPKHQKFIIYFGNGDDISSDKWLADEVQKLREENIGGVIFGVGGPPVQIPVYTGDDEQFSGYYTFRDGTEALSGFNEANLVKLAQSTGWKYFHLDARSMPDRDFFVQELTDSKVEVSRWYIFEYPVELALALILLIGLADPLLWFGRTLARAWRGNKRRGP